MATANPIPLFLPCSVDDVQREITGNSKNIFSCQTCALTMKLPVNERYVAGLKGQCQCDEKGPLCWARCKRVV